MMHAVNQNNAVNIYEDYFKDLEGVPIQEAPSARTVQCYRHPSPDEKVSNSFAIFVYTKISTF